MANSRLEKIGTIFSRQTGLIRSGALKWEDRPLWYDIYEAFPPLDEPRYDRPAPNITLKQIFYKEDRVRSIVHANKYIETANLFKNYKSVTQKFIESNKGLDVASEDEDAVHELKLEVNKFLKQQRPVKREPEDLTETVNLTTVFKEAASKQEESKITINVSDIFK